MFWKKRYRLVPGTDGYWDLEERRFFKWRYIGPVFDVEAAKAFIESDNRSPLYYDQRTGMFTQ